MTGSPETLYKLMILYMLDHVGHPLTNSQLTRFFLEKEYAGYFTLQRVLNELCDTGFIDARPVGNSTHYELCDDGRSALKFFTEDISAAARADMDGFLEENRLSLRNESMLSAEYYENSEGEYVVHCLVREQNSTALSIDITVPDVAAAETVAGGWQSKSSDVYTYLVHTLLEGDS